jgi:hypothetical protein
MRWRAVVLLGACATLLTGCARPVPVATTVSPPPASGSPVASPTCPASGVRVQPGQPDAAASMRQLQIELVNCGTVPYPLTGYPTLRVLDADRHPCQVAVAHEAPPYYNGKPQRTRAIRLAPGEAASATLYWSAVVALGGTVCGGTYLEVVARPGEQPQLIAPEHGIDLGTTGRLRVSAWN